MEAEEKLSSPYGLRRDNAGGQVECSWWNWLTINIITISCCGPGSNRIINLSILTWIHKLFLNFVSGATVRVGGGGGGRWRPMWASVCTLSPGGRGPESRHHPEGRGQRFSQRAISPLTFDSPGTLLCICHFVELLWKSECLFSRSHVVYTV
jgi:hypothetical protein